MGTVRELEEGLYQLCLFLAFVAILSLLFVASAWFSGDPRFWVKIIGALPFGEFLFGLVLLGCVLLDKLEIWRERVTA
ncbi:MAG: hypothetical protein Q7S03_00730 [bacterium]|nr:hypothetical protein [bacterium]